MFSNLHQDLRNIPTSEFVQKQFITPFSLSEIFVSCLPKVCINASIESCAKYYKNEIESLQIFLTNIADGFTLQKGALFGFGPLALLKEYQQGSDTEM